MTEIEIHDRTVTLARLRAEQVASFQDGWVAGTVVVFIISMVAAWLLPVAFTPWTVAGAIIVTWIVFLGPLASERDTSS